MIRSEIGINTHIHTPYSFSAFSSMDQIFEMANAENIKVLGINDFYTDDGYSEFRYYAEINRVYPLYCMEYIGLLKEKQDLGIRVNDPNNPGRTYICGKAFRYPFYLADENSEKLKKVVKESQDQVKAMVLKANEYFKTLQVPIYLDFNEIKKEFARNMVRERHIARAIRVEVLKKCKTDEECRKMLSLILKTEVESRTITDEAILENLIRSKLLKMGGFAFVEETETAFLPIPELVDLIIDAKGIPCYPVLLDDQNGNFTEFERDWEHLYKDLIALGIYAIELIPTRNDIQVLKKFVNFFNMRDFIVTFGTEHNTPEMIPLTIKCRNEHDLDDELKRIGNEGACVLVAHQHLVENGKEGYIDQSGKAKTDQLSDFVSLGESVLQNYLTKK